MMETQLPQLHDFESQIVNLLHRERAIDPSSLRHITDDGRQAIPHVLSSIAASLEDDEKHAEATALKEAIERITADNQFGGLGINNGEDGPTEPTETDYANSAFIVEALLLSLNSELHSRDFLTTSSTRFNGRKPMTLAEKIFAQHWIGKTSSSEELQAAAVIRVGLDWVLSSELSWAVRMRWKSMHVHDVS
jgi:hypothetical protein